MCTHTKGQTCPLVMGGGRAKTFFHQKIGRSKEMKLCDSVKLKVSQLKRLLQPETDFLNHPFNDKHCVCVCVCVYARVR